MFNKEVIENLLKTKGWTKYKLAKEAGLGQSTVHEIMSGKKKSPNAKTLQKLSEALDVSVDVFFDDNPKKEENKKRDYSLSTNEQEDIDEEAKRIIDDLSISFSKNKDTLSEEDYFAIETALKSTLEAIKIKNKKKFTQKNIDNT